MSHDPKKCNAMHFNFKHRETAVVVSDAGPSPPQPQSPPSMLATADATAAADQLEAFTLREAAFFVVALAQCIGLFRRQSALFPAYVLELGMCSEGELAAAATRSGDGTGGLVTVIADELLDYALSRANEGIVGSFVRLSPLALAIKAARKTNIYSEIV